jgi:hypothetical protein
LSLGRWKLLLPLSPCCGFFELALGTAFAPEACFAAAAATVVVATADLPVAGAAVSTGSLLLSLLRPGCDESFCC